jgi:hypothetical protein
VQEKSTFEKAGLFEENLKMSKLNAAHAKGPFKELDTVQPVLSIAFSPDDIISKPNSEISSLPVGLIDPNIKSPPPELEVITISITPITHRLCRMLPKKQLNWDRKRTIQQKPIRHLTSLLRKRSTKESSP